DFGPRLRPAPTCSSRVSCVFQETRVPEKASRVLYRFREDTENRSPNSCRASRCSDRQPDPAPPPRGLKRHQIQVGLDDSDRAGQPDPAPPPRGLKLIPWPVAKPIAALSSPTSEGIETKQRTSGRGRRCGDNEPDPAPPPRGLKLSKRRRSARLARWTS